MKALVYLHKPGIVCSLGEDTDSVAKLLFANERPPLTLSDNYTHEKLLPLGLANAPDNDGTLEPRDNSRNNRLLMLAYQQISYQIDELTSRIPKHRIGVILGTSTSGISEAETALRQFDHDGQLPSQFDYQQQEISSPAQFLARRLNLSGPCYTISTACSSGAKALASARRLIASGICDAVVCGGVDSMCRLTTNGFGALGAISNSLCMPSSKNRDGINIGEAACLFVASREPSSIALLGCGETSDAHHISAPHPNGEGAISAMQKALDDANVSPDQVDYINLHGTATEQNDRIEHRAVNTLFGDATPVSSTKAMTGHTLGAAGALEAAFCWLVLHHAGPLPTHWWDNEIDHSLPRLSLIKPGQHLTTMPRHALSNSFAFGGNNIALVLGRIFND